MRIWDSRRELVQQILKKNISLSRNVGTSIVVEFEGESIDVQHL
jgi:hypothetical protein